MPEEISGGEQVVPTQDAVTTESQQQSTQTDQATPGPGPWAKDLEGLGLDPQINQIVDKYLRDKWQPRVTELEQQYAPYKELFKEQDDGPTAAELLYSLRTDPHGTYKLIGELITEQIGFPDEQASDTSAPDTTQQEKTDPRLEYVDKLMVEREAQEQMEEFQKVYQDQKEKFPDLEEEWFAKLVIANNGNVDTAMADYEKIFPQKPAEQPPPTVGEGNTAPPEAEEYDGDFDALVRRVVAQSSRKR